MKYSSRTWCFSNVLEFRVTEDRIFIPAIIICNKLPFSQDGINSVSGNLRTDQPLRFIEFKKMLYILKHEFPDTSGNGQIPRFVRFPTMFHRHRVISSRVYQYFCLLCLLNLKLSLFRRSHRHAISGLESDPVYPKNAI